MGHFPDALRAAMAEMQWSQAEFARQIGGTVAQATIGRYLKGTDLPKPETLDLLCAPLSSRIREDLTTAYLSEHIPDSVRNRVRVSVVREGSEALRPHDPEQPLPGSDLEKIIRTLSKAAMSNVNLFHVLDALAAGIEGRQPLLAQSPGEVVVLSVAERARVLADAERDLAAQEAKSKPPRNRSVRYRDQK